MMLKGNSDATRFLEMSCSGMGGGWSTAISLFAWFLALTMIWGTIDAVREGLRGGVAKW